MNQQAAPSEHDEDAYIFIDHREDEANIVHYVSERLKPEHALQFDEGAEQMAVVFEGKTHPVPLQFSPHDRYIMIASLAELLKAHYSFFLLVPSLGSDTHGLLVAPSETVVAWDALPDHLVQLEPGYDYFSNIRIPYLGHEDAASDFSKDRDRIENSTDFMKEFIDAMFTGGLDDEAAARMAALVAKDPASSEATAGMSSADIAKELQKAMNDALGSPEVAESQKEMHEALTQLRSLANPSGKP